jgi:predicted Rossmann-fold nucleotide-binding protein
MFEAMTLIQTGKIKDFPVIIFGKDYHTELLQHIEKMLQEKTISPQDLDLFLVTDSIEDAVAHIKSCIQRFGLTHEKQPHPLKWLLERMNG